MNNAATLAQPTPILPLPVPHAPAWSVDAVLALFELPFTDLLFRAQEALRANFDPNAVQRSTLLSIKTGNCSEDCGYCSQSKRYQTGLDAQPLLSTDEVLA
ncbi:MAG: biotin synthase, partial [Candidatus Competibacteraceae bacterium]